MLCRALHRFRFRRTRLRRHQPRQDQIQAIQIGLADFCFNLRNAFGRNDIE